MNLIVQRLITLRTEGHHLSLNTNIGKKPDSSDPLKCLEKRGYIFFDVNTYDLVSAEKYSKYPDLPLTNVLCLKTDTVLSEHYKSLSKFTVFEGHASTAAPLNVDNIEI